MTPHLATVLSLLRQIHVYPGLFNQFPRKSLGIESQEEEEDIVCSFISLQVSIY